MAIGMSLHIGLNALSEEHYAGWNGRLRAGEADARSMSGIARSRGFGVELLLTIDATRGAVTTAIKRAAAELGGGDLFLLTYAGHGGQVPTATGGEMDGHDETWCLYDGQLLDDELLGLFGAFRSGVRIVVVSDSCHSGSIGRLAPAVVTRCVGVPRFMPEAIALATFHKNRAFYRRLSVRIAARTSITAAVLTWSACTDDQVAGDGLTNGVFTGRLLQVWSEGRGQFSYATLFQAVFARMPPEQTLVLSGAGSNFEALALQTAFEAAPRRYQSQVSISSTQANSARMLEQAQMMPIGYDEYWENVQGELSKRLGTSQAKALDVNYLAEMNSLLAQRRLFGGIGSMSASQGESRGLRGTTVVRVFWWGMQIEIGHEDLHACIASADPIHAFICSVGSAMPSPAAPFIALAATFVASAQGLLRGLDQGSGVYLSMTWFAPGIFVPTTASGRSATRGASNDVRASGQLCELGSDAFGFGPNWRE